ncbi:glycosyltransferase family 4 protein, partial [Okeania sp. SIO1H5]|uniref:glycosyltransferase family 4 protein n=1 Tax=Okeania sp. SIO1H5 TaxID=2607777 RepID=UPI00257D86A2
MLAPQSFFQTRGTPIAVNLIVKALTEQEHSIHMITYHEGEDVSYPRFTLERIPNPFGITNIGPGLSTKKMICSAILFFSAARRLQQEKFDLIHAVEDAAFMCLVFKIVFRKPFVFDMDSSMAEQIVESRPTFRFLGAFLKLAEKILVKNAVAVIAVCPYLENLAKNYGNKKSFLLQDISLLREPEPGFKSEAIFPSIGPSDTVFLYAGNLEEYQGVRILLQGFHRAKAS